MLLDFKSAISMAQTQKNTGMKMAGADWSVLLRKWKTYIDSKCF